MKAGDTIRSYDFEPFEGRGECYLEGTVTRVTDGYVFFKVTREVWGGEPYSGENGRVGSDCSAPLPGGMLFFPSDWPGRLTVIQEVK